MRSHYALCFFVVSQGNVWAAEPVDCDKLAHTKVPYSLTISTDNKVTTSQNYRSDQTFLTKYISMNDGKINKIILQGPFIISQKLASGTEYKFTYSGISTSNPFYEYRPKSFDLSIAIIANGNQGNPRPTHHEFSYAGIEPISIGPCVFQAIHFMDEEDNINRNSLLSKSEKWFSPDLGSTLKYKTTFFGQDGKTIKNVSGEATAISINFEPFKAQ